MNPTWIDLSERWWKPVALYKWTPEERRLAELRRRYQVNMERSLAAEPVQNADADND